MSDLSFFLKRFFSNPNTVGSLLPSSPYLASSMTKNAALTSSLRYLEVGAGSGAVTKKLIKKLGPTDHLDIVEFDPSFCALLNEKFGAHPNVTLHHASILDFKANPYDVLISSLPLNSFSPAYVAEILAKFQTLVKKGGHLSYFEYIGLGKLKQAYLSGEKLSAFNTTLKLKRQFARDFCCESDRIWFNFPPARVLHCQL